MSTSESTEHSATHDIVSEAETKEPTTKRLRGRPKKPPPPPKEPKQGPQSLYLTDRLAYHRKYYSERVRRTTSCDICNKIFNTKYALRRHLITNKTCMVIKLSTRLEEMQKEEKSTPLETAAE